MDDDVLATERFERSIGRLEEAIASRIAAAEEAAAERVATLDSEIGSLKSQLTALLAEKEALSTALDEANVECRVLEDVADTVRDRLDETIGQLRQVLST